MSVTCTEEGRTLTARIEGEVDHHAARAIMQELHDSLTAALPRTLILDLSGVSFMDSSGIALVLRTWKDMTQMGGRMLVRQVPRQAAKVLKAAGVHRLIPFEE